MTTDPIGQPWGGGTYHGFSGPRPAAAPTSPVAPVKRRAWQVPRAATIGGGIAAAVALGLALGYFARPHLAQPTTPTPMRAVTPAAGGTLPVEVNAPVPPPPLKSAGKLEVLPPDLARNAPRAPAALPAAPPLPVVSTPAYPAPAYPSAEPSRPIARGPYETLAPQVASGDPACAGVRGRAAQMVCADPQLADADRELNRAYRRALRSGVSPDQLRADQRDWLAIREDAARHSPRAVASVYEQRIDELNQIADDGPG